MKKLIVTIAALILVYTCAFSVMAADEFATAGDLYQYWAATYPPDYTSSFPDYVCGVWSTDGGMTNLTIAVQDNEAGNAGKQEILDLIADDSTVTFIYQEYSLNYLRSVQEEISLYFEKDLGLVFTGVDEYKNRVTLGILEEKIDETATQKTLSELYAKYGDIFVVEYSSGMVVTLEDTLADISSVKNDNNKYLIPLICAEALLAAGTVVIVLKKKNSLSLQTNTGKTIAASASLSTKEVENMVKNSNTEVTSDLDRKIMSKIENR